MEKAGPSASEVDAELVALARGEGRMKLRLGELLDELFTRGGHHELGFSSIDAYVIERVQQSSAWGRQARSVARRLREKGLDRLRGSVVAGDLSWSKAELLSRHATTDTEVELLRAALGSTVRTLKSRLEGSDSEREEIPSQRVSTTMPVSETEVAMVIATRRMVGHLVGREVGDEAFVEALLAEAETSLQQLGHDERGSRSIQQVDFAALEGALEAMKPRPRRKARPDNVNEPVQVRRFEPVRAAPVPGTIKEIDAEIVRLSRALARRNLELGQQLCDFTATRRWARQGFPSLGTYARERLGLSLSSVEHRITLARAADRHPSLEHALASGEDPSEGKLCIPVEQSALLVVARRGRIPGVFDR